MTTRTVETTLGELIATVYEEFLTALGDEEVAAIATASTINELFAEPEAHEQSAAA